MTIKLNSGSEDALIVAIAEGIQATKITRDFLSRTMFDWAIKLNSILPEDAKEKIERHCGSGGIRSFIYHEVYAELRASPGGPKLTPGHYLGDYPTFKNSVGYAKRLVDKLKHIPIRYRATVALPGNLAYFIINEMPSPTDLGQGISLSRGSDLPKPLPIESNNDQINKRLFHNHINGFKGDRNLSDDVVYFSMPILGYATHSASGALGRLFEDHIKAFYGAGMAIGLLSFDWSYSQKDDRRPFIMIHIEEGRHLIETEILEQEICDAAFYVSTEDYAGRHQDDLWKNLKIDFNRLKTVFHDTKDGRKLFTACIWYYRAMISKRPLDRLLESTISIEVLLGDRQMSEGIGLSKLLGNRCAFLLGESSSQRDNIIDTFGKIYTLRSTIVHEGKHKLEPRDAETVDSAIKLCGQIIEKELRVRSNTM